MAQLLKESLKQFGNLETMPKKDAVWNVRREIAPKRFGYLENTPKKNVAKRFGYLENTPKTNVVWNERGAIAPKLETIDQLTESDESYATTRFSTNYDFFTGELSTEEATKLLPQEECPRQNRRADECHNSTIWNSGYVRKSPGSEFNNENSLATRCQEGSSHSIILDSEHIRTIDCTGLVDSPSDAFPSSSSSRKGLIKKSMWRLKMKSRAVAAWAKGRKDDLNTPLLNPNAIHDRRSLHFTWENLDSNDAETTNQEVFSRFAEPREAVPFTHPPQVLSPSFALHERGVGVRRKSPPCNHSDKSMFPPKNVSFFCS